MRDVNTKAIQHLLEPPHGTPALAPEIYEHAQRVSASLLDRLNKHNNWISFSDYMQFCLYEPELGYYSGGLQKFGVDGDFTTAPEISPLFGECIAEAMAGLLRKNPEWSICELGPGRGALAESLLTHLNRVNALPASYQLLEVSESLSSIQKQRLNTLELDTPVIHLDKPPVDFKGIIIANEVLDALVVERFHIDADGNILQIGVGLQNEELVEEARLAPEYLVRAINALEHEIPRNYSSEICIQLKPWLANIVENLQEAILLFSDYGFSQHEYYSPERSQGTLRCHYRQHAHNNSLRLPGLQDITAWVNFTQLGDAALSLDLDVVSYSTQAHFLLGSGRLQQINFDSLDDIERYKTSQAIQTLTLPANMGERFRFMQLNKNCDEVIPAMAFRDLRHQL